MMSPRELLTVEALALAGRARCDPVSADLRAAQHNDSAAFIDLFGHLQDIQNGLSREIWMDQFEWMTSAACEINGEQAYKAFSKVVSEALMSELYYDGSGFQPSGEWELDQAAHITETLFEDPDCNGIVRRCATHILTSIKLGVARAVEDYNDLFQKKSDGVSDRST